MQFVTRHSKLSAVKKMPSGYEAMLANGDVFVSHDLMLLDVKLAGLVFQVEFVVVENPPNDVVLGLSFLINTKSNVDFWNDKLVLAQERRKMALHWNTNELSNDGTGNASASVAMRLGFASLFILKEINRSSRSECGESSSNEQDRRDLC